MRLRPLLAIAQGKSALAKEWWAEMMPPTGKNQDLLSECSSGTLLPHHRVIRLLPLGGNGSRHHLFRLLQSSSSSSSVTFLKL